jgi:S1-C subfamily serine protease
LTSGRSRYAQPSTVGGALISGVVSDGPAAAAGLTAGDTITAVDGTTIDSASALTETLAGDTPGQTVTITWVDPSGSTQTASVTLTNGPAG